MVTKYLRGFAAVGLIGLLCGVAVEIAIRIYVGVPVLALQDWRGQMATILQGAAEYHPVLGWTHVSHYKGAGLNTIDHGIRKNTAGPEQLDKRAILAVGDSFTAGSEVTDQDTWPAQLEKLIGRRVINAGIGGYGVDQSVLNAERLLPVVKPELVLIGIFEDDIERTAYSIYNAPKPYFISEGGGWTLRNSPVPIPRAVPPDPPYKKLLSLSLAAQIFFNKVARDWWYESKKNVQYVRSGTDPVGATCHALTLLHKRLAAENIPAMVVMQYGGRNYAIERPIDRNVFETAQCAKELGYTVVDEHPRIAAIAAKSVDELKKLYVMHPYDVFGHMSPAGNTLVAEMIAEKIRSMAPNLARE